MKLLHERTLLAVDVDAVNTRLDTFLAELDRSSGVIDAFLVLRSDVEH